MRLSTTGSAARTCGSSGSALRPSNAAAIAGYVGLDRFAESHCVARGALALRGVSTLPTHQLMV